MQVAAEKMRQICIFAFLAFGLSGEDTLHESRLAQRTFGLPAWKSTIP
jgi:hypothetical protein